MNTEETRYASLDQRAKRKDSSGKPREWPWIMFMCLILAIIEYKMFTFDGQYIMTPDWSPHAQGIENKQQQYVCDRENSRFLVFDRELNYI